MSDERLAAIEAQLSASRRARWTMDYPVGSDDVRWLVDRVRAAESERDGLVARLWQMVDAVIGRRITQAENLKRDEPLYKAYSDGCWRSAIEIRGDLKRLFASLEQPLDQLEANRD